MNKLKLCFVMLLWGSIGIFTRYIDLSPIMLAFLRALIAILPLYFFHRSQKKETQLTFKKIVPFMINGIMLGLAWTCLFVAFKNTSVSISVLVYNMCPVYVLILAPIILKEKLNKVQCITVIVAFFGLFIIINNAINTSDFSLYGVVFGLLSGVLYAMIVILNRMIKTELDASTITLIQIVSATIILIPLMIVDGNFTHVLELDLLSITLIAILGVVHTGIAYHLYFSTYKKLSAITIVSYSYLEPLFSIILSSIILGELISINLVIGGCLILCATYIGEYSRNLSDLKTF